MSVTLKKWLIMNGMSTAIFVYVGIFVNLYIWEKNHSIFEVSFFNLVMYFAWALAFTWAAYVLSKLNLRLLLWVSSCAGGVAFSLLSFIHLDNRLIWLTLIALPVGTMYGFFSASDNLCVSLCGTKEELGHYFTTVGSMQQVITLLVPMLSATIIHYFGYTGTFVMMLVFLAAMLLLSLTMPAISLKPHFQERPYFSQMFRDTVYKKPRIRWLAASSLCFGIFMQFQQLFLLIFTFSVTENKFWIAALNAAYTLSTLSGLFFYRKLRLRESVMLLIGCLLAGSGVLIVLIPEKPILIISNLLTAVGMYYLGAAFDTNQFRLIKAYSQSRQAMLLIWRELLLCVSRIATLSVVLSVKGLHGGLFIVLIGISLLSLAIMPYCEHRARQAPEQGDEAAAPPLPTASSAIGK